MENNVEKSSFNMSRVLRTLKRNIWLILIVVILVSMAGYGYTKIQKPSYTASEGMFFKAQNIENNTTSYNINAMRAYIDTVLDFCDEGVVLDRAEYYYVNYANAKYNHSLEGEKYTVKDFIAENEQNDTYIAEENSARKHFSKGAIRVHAEETEELETSFYFTISYTDSTLEYAQDKVEILAYAFNKESKEIVSENELKYFEGVLVEVNSSGSAGVINNVSKTRTMILFGLIGIALALFIVYIKTILDNTLKKSEDLEEITGVSNFAHIGRKKGGK